jgi:hypothetical protein
VSRITSVFLASNFRVALSAAGLDSWRRLRLGMFDSYRPELHYMRGPGPKWREKHAHATSVSPVSITDRLIDQQIWPTWRQA